MKARACRGKANRKNKKKNKKLQEYFAKDRELKKKKKKSL